MYEAEAEVEAETEAKAKDLARGVAGYGLGWVDELG